MNLRHVNIVSHKVTSGTLHYCTLFKNRNLGGPKNQMPNFVSNGLCCCFALFFFSKKEQLKKSFSTTCYMVLTLLKAYVMVRMGAKGLEWSCTLENPLKKGCLLWLFAFVLVKCLGIGEG